MIDELESRAGKYRKALSGDGFAFFSIIGTEDWQDYAQLAFDAMHLEATLDLDARVESLSATMIRIEGLLERLTRAVEQDTDQAAVKGPEVERSPE